MLAFPFLWPFIRFSKPKKHKVMIAGYCLVLPSSVYLV